MSVEREGSREPSPGAGGTHGVSKITELARGGARAWPRSGWSQSLCFHLVLGAAVRVWNAGRLDVRGADITGR